MAAPSNRIAEYRKKRKMSQRELAEAVGSHWVTISNLERGKAPFTIDWAEKIARVLKADAFSLMIGKKPFLIHLEGTFDAQDIKLWDEGKAVSVEVVARNLYPFWLLVSDNSAYPIFQSGDFIRVIPMDETVAACVGCLCIMRPEGAKNTFVGYLTAGSEPGTFGAIRTSGPPLVDIKLELLGLIDRSIYQPRLSAELQKHLKI